jgi:hypothetical protein
MKQTIIALVLIASAITDAEAWPKGASGRASYSWAGHYQRGMGGGGSWHGGFSHASSGRGWAGAGRSNFGGRH